MALPVVTVASGGLAVVEVTAFGNAVTEAPSGIAVTKVTGGKPGLGVTYVSATGGPAVTYATLDGVPTLTTLSNGNLTATWQSGGGGGARSNSNKSTGKYYFEFTVVNSHGTSNSAGIIIHGATYSQIYSAGQASVTVGFGNGNIWSNNINSGKTLGTIANGSVIGFAVDLGTLKGWIRNGSGNWNGDAAANPATNANGVTLPSSFSWEPVVVFLGGTVGDAVTFNLGASAFVGAVPSGFTAGWPA